MEGFRFPTEYYSVCSTQTRRTRNWFCNKALSPTMDDITSEFQKIMEDPDIIPNSDDESTPPSLDSKDDPDFVLHKEDESESYTSSTESNISTEYPVLHSINIPTVISEPIEHKENNNSEGKQTTGKSNLSRRALSRDFCFFCENLVANFARHLQRNHQGEMEVQKCLSLPVKSKERKVLFSKLRKRGNYINNVSICKPVKKYNVENNLLPCTHCLGFYSAKQLWKHKKHCHDNLDKAPCSQIGAQNFLIKHLKVDQQLKDKVFTHMRSEKISLTAKKDALICAYGSCYLKVHREKHFIPVVSRKMRELEKLLLEAQQIDPSIKNLFLALQPKNYDILVAATKVVAQYNVTTDQYKSPTYAINIGTTLKQCCEIAITYALKKKAIYETIQAADAEADLKMLLQLLESHWRFDVSIHAADDLSIKKWNKVTLVPLACDLKLIKEYLTTKATSATSKLKRNPHQIAYNQLLETIYCRLLLLNRRRPGELQRLLLQQYQESEKNIKENYEEFSEIITPTEKILMKRFKRLIIRGKRGRGVPVLFAEDIQADISVLLEYRSSFVKDTNSYLFGKPNVDTPICGYKVLAKHAKACGAKKPEAITSTKLRKHLTTLTQIFNMSESDIEQLATFMGHTTNIHRKSYRLPDDVYQTAKISKLLLLMENGSAGEFKGKALGDINIDLEDDLNELAGTEKYIVDIEDEDEKEDLPKDKFNKLHNSKMTTYTEKRTSKRNLIPWTRQQKQIVDEFFNNHIRKKRAPKKQECEELINTYPEQLSNKNWLKIKVYVQNKYTKKIK